LKNAVVDNAMPVYQIDSNLIPYFSWASFSQQWKHIALPTISEALLIPQTFDRFNWVLIG